jgi:hypothetical protein
MTGILTFDTPHGRVAVEVDDATALAAADGAEGDGGWVAKGPARRIAGGTLIAHASTSLDEAMTTVRAYAASIDEMMRGLAVAPDEVSVELGLRLAGSAGFVIAKAGAESQVRIALTWKPRLPRAGAGA